MGRRRTPRSQKPRKDPTPVPNAPQKSQKKRGRPPNARAKGRPRTSKARKKKAANAAHAAMMNEARLVHKSYQEHVEMRREQAKNSCGRIRGYGEVLAIITMALSLWIEGTEMHRENPMACHKWVKVQKGKVCWGPICDRVALLVKCCQATLKDQVKNYLEDGSVLLSAKVFNGVGSPGHVNNAQRLSPDQLAAIDKHILNSKGSMTIRRIQKYINDEFPDVTISRSAVRRAVTKFLGYRWGITKAKKCNSDPERVKVIRTYLRDYADAIRKEEAGTHVIVYTDESYIRQNHAAKCAWHKVNGDGRVDRKTSKGKRLIILHAITKDGPLYVANADGSAPQGQDWFNRKRGGGKSKKEGDTPHAIEASDPAGVPLTCELLWKAGSNTGDYHDNMNSEMHMQWVHERLIPTFKAKYPNKKMLLVQDNAPYHHNRGIPSLSSKNTKPDMLALMQKHGINQITLPALAGRRAAAIMCPVNDEMLQRASNAKPNVPTLGEMKNGFLGALRSIPEKRGLLDCKIERALKDEGYELLWTPAYSPKLQPIEVFWAQGKNHAAWNYKVNENGSGPTMRQCVAFLRAGWYGDIASQCPADLQTGRKACDCRGLVGLAQEEANILINTAGVGDGLSGTITDLKVDENAVFVSADETAAILLLADQNMLLPAEEDGFAADMPDDEEEEGDEDAADI